MMDALEVKADRLLMKHKTRKDAYYTERTLERKQSAHELRYEWPPERLQLAFGELDGMAVLDLLHFGELAGLNTQQTRVWELTVHGLSMAEVGRVTGVTRQSVDQMLHTIRRRVAGVAANNPHYGWLAAYLETVLMRHLF